MQPAESLRESKATPSFWRQQNRLWLKLSKELCLGAKAKSWLHSSQFQNLSFLTAFLPFQLLFEIIFDRILQRLLECRKVCLAAAVVRANIEAAVYANNVKWRPKRDFEEWAARRPATLRPWATCITIRSNYITPFSSLSVVDCEPWGFIGLLCSLSFEILH